MRGSAPPVVQTKAILPKSNLLVAKHEWSISSWRLHLKVGFESQPFHVLDRYLVIEMRVNHYMIIWWGCSPMTSKLGGKIPNTLEYHILFWGMEYEEMFILHILNNGESKCMTKVWKPNILVIGLMLLIKLPICNKRCMYVSIYYAAIILLWVSIPLCIHMWGVHLVPPLTLFDIIKDAHVNLCML